MKLKIPLMSSNPEHHDLIVPVALTGDKTIDDLIWKCIETIKVKGNDYTQGKGDANRLHNFDTVAGFLNLSPEKVWSVYFYKHYASLMRYVEEGRVESEPIESRIMDMIVYLFLMAKMVDRKASADVPKATIQNTETDVQLLLTPPPQNETELMDMVTRSAAKLLPDMQDKLPGWKCLRHVHCRNGSHHENCILAQSKEQK